MPIYKVDGAKKDGLQKYNVRINYVSRTDGKPKQLTRAAYGHESAKDLERQLLNEIKDIGNNPTRKMTFQQLFNEYVAVRKHEVRESTIDKHERNYRLYVQSLMADVRIDKLTTGLLMEWKLSIEQKELTVKTKNHAYSLLNAVLNYALKMEYIIRNPLPLLGRFKDVLYVKQEMKIYTAQEFKSYVASAKKYAVKKQAEQHTFSEWDYYVLFNIAFYTGLRKGEIYALKWSDIDGVYLSVKRSITYKLKGGDRETPPKNKSSIRTLQMPLPLIKVLNEQKKRQEQLEHFTEDYRVCGGERCLRDSTVNKRNKLYAELADLTPIRIHDFRHSHVSVLANEGINIQEIARRLGHTRVEETWNTYSHMYPREQEKAVEILNSIA